MAIFQVDWSFLMQEDAVFISIHAEAKVVINTWYRFFEVVELLHLL